jgi:hypothetical protein
MPPEKWGDYNLLVLGTAGADVRTRRIYYVEKS